MTGAKTGTSLFHLSNRKNWEISYNRDFWHAMDMKFSLFLNEFKQLRNTRNERDKLGYCPGSSHAGAASTESRQIAHGGRCLNNCTVGGKYTLHGAVQNALVKALNGKNIKAVLEEAHPYVSESNRTDISISTADAPAEVVYYVDTTVTNSQQTTIPKLKKLSAEDNIVCCQNLLLNQVVVNNHIFSATNTKLHKYKRCHESAVLNGAQSNSVIVPFAVDTQGNFCSVAMIFLKEVAKLKFKNIPGDGAFKDQMRAIWVNTTCRNIQTAIIKTCAYNNRSALKRAFGKDYNKMYPGTIYTPPSYNEHFSSADAEG